MFLKQDINSRQTGRSTTEWLIIRQWKTLWQPCVTAQIFETECWAKEVRIYTTCFCFHKVQKLAKQTDGVKVRTLATPGACVSRWVHSGRNGHAVRSQSVHSPVCVSHISIYKVRNTTDPGLLPSRLPSEVSCISVEQQLIPQCRTSGRPRPPCAFLSRLTQFRANLLDASPLPPARCPPGLLPGLSCAHPPSPHSVLHNGSHSNHCWTYNSSPYKCAPSLLSPPSACDSSVVWPSRCPAPSAQRSRRQLTPLHGLLSSVLLASALAPPSFRSLTPPRPPLYYCIICNHALYPLLHASSHHGSYYQMVIQVACCKVHMFIRSWTPYCKIQT